jgi:hypothetical protein
VVVVFTIGVPAVAKLSREDSQLRIIPVCPLKVSVAEFAPEQTVAAGLTLPPTDTGFTVMVVEVALAAAQVPFCTMAL